MEENRCQPQRAKQHADQLEAGQRALTEKQRGEDAGGQRRKAEEDRNQPGMNVARRPVSERHGDEQAKAADQIGAARPVVQRKTDAPGDDDGGGDKDADQHAGEDGEGKTGALGTPLDGQWRGGPDQDDAKIGEGYGHSILRFSAVAARADVTRPGQGARRR